MGVHDGCATLMDAHGAVGEQGRQGSAATTMTLMGSGAGVHKSSATLMDVHGGA